MTDTEIFHKVVILCARDVHRTRAGSVRKVIPKMSEMMNNLKCMIKDGEDQEDIIFEASRQSGLKYDKFVLKLGNWLYAFNNKLWCTMCGERPVRKGNRRFCSNCFQRASGKDSIHVSGGHKVCRTGGAGRER